MKLPPALYTPWVIVAHHAGETTYYGPFTTEDRAREYAKSIQKAVTLVLPMVAPHEA